MTLKDMMAADASVYLNTDEHAETVEFRAAALDDADAGWTELDAIVNRTQQDAEYDDDGEDLATTYEIVFAVVDAVGYQAKQSQFRIDGAIFSLESLPVSGAAGLATGILMTQQHIARHGANLRR